MPGCGGCGAGLRSFGQRVGKLCEYDGEEPGHAKLQRLLEEREREQAAARARAKQKAIEEERLSREWQSELQALAKQRESMDQEELEQDCLSHFACAEVLRMSPARNGERQASKTAEPAADERKASKTAEAAADGRKASKAAEPAAATPDGSPRRGPVEAGEGPPPGDPPPPPSGPVELWFEELFGTAGPSTPRSAALSFGELPAASCGRLAEGLAGAIARATEEAEKAATEAQGTPTVVATGLSEALDRLLEKYAAEEAEAKGAAGADVVNNETPAEVETAVRELKARAAHHRTVGARVTALMPCLAEDLATTRLVCMLAALDVGSAGGPFSASECGAGDFRAPLRAPSTADVCWALCSEKRRLVVDALLPGALAKGRWCWPEIRRTGLGWWLGGAGTEVLDALVTKLAQSAVAQLRHKSADGLSEASQSAHKRSADEALFWYVLLGTKLARLRALLKTGVLSGEPALAQLLEHPRSGEPQFVRKNAFRLLQLHRFHLAAALFVLGDCHEEAAQVVAGHLHDFQLVLVLARRQPALARPLLRSLLAESPLPARDPWLRLLLAWHAGDREAVAACRAHAPAASAGVAAEPDPGAEGCTLAPAVDGVFDGVLRLSSSREGLDEVVQLLLQNSVGG